MTVCVGAICCDVKGAPGQAVVVASDRMVTMGGLTEFEHDVPKITALSDRIVTLVAGDALRGSELVRLVGGLPADAQVRPTAQLLALRYAELRRAVVEAFVLIPRGLSLAEFYQGGVQQRLIPPVAGSIDQEIARFDLGLEVLVAGVDSQGGHLLNARNPGGVVDDLDPIGFHAVGSGALHAVQSMIGFSHAPNRPLHETVFRAFASKRRAEIAPGVGHTTDLWVIQAAGVTKLSVSTLEALDALYTEYALPAREELDRRIKDFDFTAPPNGSAA